MNFGWFLVASIAVCIGDILHSYHVAATRFHRNPERTQCYHCSTGRIGAAHYAHDETSSTHQPDCSTNSKAILDAKFRNHTIYCKEHEICGVFMQHQRWVSTYSTYNLTRGCFHRMKIHKACTDIHEEWIEPNNQGDMVYTLSCQCEGHFCNDWTYNSLRRRYWTEVTALTSSISHFSLADDPYYMSTTWSKAGHQLGADYRVSDDECCFTNLTDPETAMRFECYQCTLELDEDGKEKREGVNTRAADDLCISNNKQVLDRLYRFRQQRNVPNMGGCSVTLQERRDSDGAKFYVFERGYVSNLTNLTNHAATKFYNGCTDLFPILPDQYFQDQFQMTCACASDYCNDYTYESIFKRFNSQDQIFLQKSSKYLPVTGALPLNKENSPLY